MDPVTSLAAKVAAPAAAAGYRALALEWKRIAANPDAPQSLGSLDAALDEAFGVLAQQSATLHGTAIVKLKGLAARPKIFEHAIPAAWIATERAQDALRDAVHALLVGASDVEPANRAIAHYASYLGDPESETAPAGQDVYIAALEFVQRSLDRHLDINGRVLLAAIAGVGSKIDALARPEASEFVDAHLLAEVEKLRKRRFFGPSKIDAEARALAGAVVEGRFRSAGHSVKGLAFAQCARWLSTSDPALAAELLDKARSNLGRETSETRIAEAFLDARAGKAGAISRLDIDGSPAEATAALQIIRLGLADNDALCAFADAKIGMETTDADGRHILLALQIQAEQWEEALASIASLSADDFERTPILYWEAATMLVAVSAPPDVRGVLLQDIPTQPALFRLREESEYLEQRRLAGRYLAAAAEASLTLDLPESAEAARRYALWLALRDPKARDDALLQLRARMDDPRTTLAYLPLALSFGVDIDRTAAIDLIDKARVRHSGNPQQLAAAMLALILDSPEASAQEAADLFVRYRDFLADYIETASFVSLEVNLLASAGLFDRATAVLDAARDELPSVMRELLESVVAGPGATDSLDALEKAYAAAPGHALLGQLVEQYRQAGYSPRYVELARAWLADAPNAADGLKIVRSLVVSRRFFEASDIVDLLGDVALQSDALLIEGGWAHFEAGRFDKAERMLALIESRRDHQQDRALRVQLLLASGRWTELDAFVERQWVSRAERDALELAQCGVLAAEIGSKRAREFIGLAVERGPDEPQVLAAAYGAATTAGLEEDWDDAAGWIVRAAELSGSEGPVQSASLVEIVAEQPRWNKRVEDGHRMIAASSAPIETAGKVLRKSLTELQFLPMLANREQKDIRQHVAIPLFAGNRRSVATFARGRVAFDRTSVITLAALDVLEEILSYVGTAIVAHDLLRKLFEDRRRIKFHQPSRVTFAHQLLAMLHSGKVVAFRASRTPDPALVAAVGESLAGLLGEAASQTIGQHLVVQPSPVMRVGSLLTTPEPVSLDAFSSNLCSCSAVVDALEREGRLTKAELNRARAYLARTDGIWPNEPVVERGATLYLSDLAVSYFRYVGVLEKLGALDLTVVIAQSELDEAAALRQWDSYASKTATQIDRIGAVIAKAYGAGRLLFDSAPDIEDEAQSARTLTQLAERSDLLICDDRFFGRFENFDHPAGRTPIASTLDLLDDFYSGDPDGRASVIEARTRLRQSGALFMPFQIDELLELLEAAPLDDERVRETAELRAIRENVRLAQMRGWIDLPAERNFLVGLNTILFDAIIEIWRTHNGVKVARARADWLFNLASMRDWSDSQISPGQYRMAIDGIILDLAKLAFGASGMAKKRRASFANWFEKLLVKVWDNEPNTRELFLDYLRGLLRSVIDDALRNENGLSKGAAMALAIDGIPSFLQVAIFEEDTFRAEMGQEVGYTVTIGGEFSFSREVFLRAVQSVYADARAKVTLTDARQQKWKMTADRESGGWPISFVAGKQRHVIRGVFSLIPEKKARLSAFDAAVRSADIPPGALTGWRTRLEEAPLEADEIAALEQELATWPGTVSRTIVDTIPRGAASLSILVPADTLYYERLIGAGEPATIEDYCQDVAPEHIAALAADDPLDQAKAALLLAAHPRVLHQGGFPDLAAAQWCALAAWVRAEGDLLSRIGFLEIAMPHAIDDTALEEMLVALVGEIAELDPLDESGRLHFLASTVQLVDGEFSRTGVLAGWPPFRRRLAAFAHAALIERSCFGRVDAAHFSRFAVEQRRGWFFVQTMTDLRLEPRWRPEFVLADQLKNELVGRTFNRAAAMSDKELSSGLRATILAEDASFRDQMHFPRMFWPGPIEGGLSDEIQPPPEEMMTLLEQAFAKEEVPLNGLNLLANLETPYHISAEFLNRALPKIIAEGTSLLSILPDDSISFYLIGLGSLAGSHRRGELAAHIRMLMRYQRNMKATVPLGEEIRLALACSAAHPEINEWRTFLGDWLREIAFRIEPEDAGELVGWLEMLFSVDPALRATAGRAYAAARALTEN